MEEASLHLLLPLEGKLAVSPRVEVSTLGAITAVAVICEIHRTVQHRSVQEACTRNTWFGMASALPSMVCACALLAPLRWLCLGVGEDIYVHRNLIAPSVAVNTFLNHEELTATFQLNLASRAMLSSSDAPAKEQRSFTDDRRDALSFAIGEAISEGCVADDKGRSEGRGPPNRKR